MKPVCIAFALACLLGGRAFGAEVLVRPVWKAAPSSADVQLAFARIRSGERGYSGFRCEVAPNGSLKHCDNFWGPGDFVAGALSLVPDFVVDLPPGIVKPHQTLVVELYFDVGPQGQSAAIYLDRPEVAGDHAATAFPAQAVSGGVRAGFALIEASADQSGMLGGCTVVKETPTNLGFGSSACAAAQTWKLNLWQRGLAVAGARLRIPVYIATANADDDPSLNREVVYHPPGQAPFYPDRAFRMHVTGSATIECVLSADGALGDCLAVSETPPDQDFGAASVMMANRGAITARPRFVDGKAVPAEVVKVKLLWR